MSSTDSIILRGLRVLAYCGVLAEEQARRQPFELDIDIEVDLLAAGLSDDLEDTIDYGALCAEIEALVRNERYALLERLGQRVADLVLEHRGARAVTVEVRKLRPPVPQHLDSSGVRIRRTGPGA